jgi:hypothetical protein
MEDVYTMKDDELIEMNSQINATPSSAKSPYGLFMRQSRKLGRVATKAFREMKEVLNRDIVLPSAEQFLNSFPRLHLPNKQSGLDELSRLKNRVKRYHQVIGSARTVFPMTIFRDSIIVDRTKISIIKRDFFWTSNVVSFRIEDVLNVSCGVGPLFGSLTIASRVMSTVDHFRIDYLWRSDAIKMNFLIQGYIIAKNNKLETDHLSRRELFETLCELGVDSDR